MNWSKCAYLKYIICMFFMYTDTMICYPIEKVNADPPKDETRYPNGTVIGKYTYTDNQGNPIHVKYYADNSSYGVELKSVKVTGINTEEAPWQSNNYDTFKSLEPRLGMPSDIFTTDLDIKKNNSDSKNKDNKTFQYKNAKSSDYDTFYQNDIKQPRQCDKDKVRVYLDKEKKIIRRALESYQAAKHCNQF